MEIVLETDYGRSDHPFVPNYFIDITEYIDPKIQALKIYDTELRQPLFPRGEENARALARVRGASAGVNYAEAFRLITNIDK